MTTLSLLVILGLVAVAVVLITGIASMAHGGESDRRQSRTLMLARVGVQGIALMLVLVAQLLSLR